MSSWSAASPAEARALDVWPLDASNVALLDAVHPRDWKDPEPPSSEAEYDLIAIGAGAGGLVSSKQSARCGARSCMISEHLAGGDCLNVGCVPSKALLHCSRVAREMKAAHFEGLFGKNATLPSLDFGAVMARMRRLRAQIAPADSHDATVATGADVYQGRGRFVGPDRVEVNGKILRFKKAVVATGGRAAVPPIPGLASAPYLTNATLYNLTALPPRLVVIGSGAVGLEMAQAFSVFGSKVTVLVRSGRILSKECEATSEALQKALTADGVTFVFEAEVEAVRTLAQGSSVGGSAAALPLLSVTVRQGGGAPEQLECEALLVATGRVPNVADLGLEDAGIKFTADQGIRIDDLGATSNPHVFAIGDCAAGVPRFTHVAGEMAKLAVQNALFGDAWRVSSLCVPRCVYTEPEAAAVGLTPSDAASQGLAIDRYTTSLAHNDRAILEGVAASGDGCFVELYCREGTETIVGAAIVAPHAGDLISEVTLAMQTGTGLATLARVIHPYPTLGEGVMGCGLAYIRKHWQTMPAQKKRKAAD